MFQIERGDPDGSNRITMVNGLSHPWGVAVYDSYLYFTDRDFEVIERVDKATGLNRVVMRDNVAGLRVLKVHYRDCEYIKKKHNGSVPEPSKLLLSITFIGYFLLKSRLGINSMHHTNSSSHAKRTWSLVLACC